MRWLQSILGWESLSEPDQFLADARAELNAGEITAYSPDGMPVLLPVGATGIDFAYAIDAETGNGAAGVAVDGRLRPMAAPLRNGQVVEVIMSEFPDEPSESWLSAVRTPRARAHIRQAIARRRADEMSSTGRQAVKAAAGGAGIDLQGLEADGTALQVSRKLGYPADLDALYIAVAAGKVDARDVATMLGSRKNDGHG
jgi:GTP pyrophosphokinase